MAAVLWRALALLAALVLPLLLMLAPLARALPEPWVGAALAFACALPIAWRFVEQRVQALLGAALAGLAALLAPQLPPVLRATASLDELPLHDLREAPLDAAAGEWVSVRGYLRNEWTLDEYRVAKGERPDQNSQAPAVIVPLLGTEAEQVDASTGIVLVARVTPELAARGGLHTLRGHVVEVSPQIVETLFLLPEGVDARGRARMLDTFDLPTPSEAYTQLGLLVAALLLGSGLLVTAVPSGTRVGGPAPRE